MKLNNLEKQILEEMKIYFNENKKNIGYSLLKKNLEFKNIFPNDKLLRKSLNKLFSIGYVKFNNNPENFGYEVKKWN